MDSSLLIVVLAALTLWLFAGSALRTTAIRVNQYYAGKSAPDLAHSVWTTAIAFFAAGSFFGLICGLFLFVGGANRPTELVTLGLILFIAIYMLLTGVFLMRWSGVIQSAPEDDDSPWSFINVVAMAAFFGLLSLFVVPIRTVKRGALIAFLLSWWMMIAGAFLALFFSITASYLGILIFAAWVIFLIIAVMLETIMAFLHRVHQRYWTLWHLYLAICSRKPLDSELKFLSEFSGGQQRRKLKDMCEELYEGAEPEEVFDHAGLVSSLEGAQLATGLKTGKLPQVLNEILRRRAEFATKLPHLQSPVIAILYLWVVVLVMYSVTGFISYWITPKFKRIFDDFGTELPRATQWIIRASDQFADIWVLGVPGILLGLGLLTALALLPVTGGLSGLRERFAWFWPRICLPDVLRGLALAAEANVPFEEAFIPFVRRQLRVPLHNRLVRAQEVVRDGGDCWIALENERLLRLSEAQFLRSAQRAGNLPWALKTLSTRFEQRWQFWMLFLFEFVQPVVVLTISVIVAFVAIAYFLPLVKLINDLA